MGYEDSFYVAINIIGYTGDLHDKPTVYFKNGHRFGHITQSHKKADNIGREKVHTNKNYKIENVYFEDSKEERAVESIGKIKFHKSRNKFIPLGNDDDKTRNILAIAIKNFTAMKNICLDPNYPNLDEK